MTFSDFTIAFPHRMVSPFVPTSSAALGIAFKLDALLSLERTVRAFVWIGTEPRVPLSTGFVDCAQFHKKHFRSLLYGQECPRIYRNLSEIIKSP